jgi:ABC-type transport system substrate-binding protein
MRMQRHYGEFDAKEAGWLRRTFVAARSRDIHEMNQFTSWEVASKENKWQGRNITRWRSEEYDKTFRAAEAELDPVKRTALFIRMNDLVCDNQVVIPQSSTARASRRSPTACAPASVVGTVEISGT